jgi:hypothetical protein
VRTFRKATGQKLLLDDATYQAIVDTLKQRDGTDGAQESPSARRPRSAASCGRLGDIVDGWLEWAAVTPRRPDNFSWRSRARCRWSRSSCSACGVPGVPATRRER